MSSEAVLVGTVGILGATVGLSAIRQSVNDEMTELAFALRSLDQSYSIPGMKGCGSWTAGSEFIQRNVEESIEDLCANIEELQQEQKHEAEEKSSASKKKEEMKKREEQRKRDAERKQREQDRKKKEETGLSA